MMTPRRRQPQGRVVADLKELCALTDGNLSRHRQVLHEAGLIEVWKGFSRNRPQTVCKITGEGKRRFLDYINVLENVIADALKDVGEPAPSSPLAEGWSPACGAARGGGPGDGWLVAVA